MEGPKELPPDLEKSSHFTPRQNQILALMNQGVTNYREIGERLGISPRTIKNLLFDRHNSSRSAASRIEDLTGNRPPNRTTLLIQYKKLLRVDEESF